MFDHYIHVQSGNPRWRKAMSIAAVASGVTTASLMVFAFVANKMNDSARRPPLELGRHRADDDGGLHASASASASAGRSGGEDRAGARGRGDPRGRGSAGRNRPAQGHAGQGPRQGRGQVQEQGTQGSRWRSGRCPGRRARRRRGWCRRRSPRWHRRRDQARHLGPKQVAKKPITAVKAELHL